MSNNNNKSNKLLTDAIRQRLPKLYSQEAVEDPIAQVKFFTPDSQWSWYAYYVELHINSIM